MGDRAFFLDEACSRTAETISALERTTGAEVVVAMRRRSASYRDLDYLVGFALALLTLLALLFLPEEFPLWTFPIDVSVAFVLGAMASARLPALQRLLLGRERRDAEVRRAAQAAFVELGVGRTRERVGLLVYASLLERRVEVVADVGVDPAALGPGYGEALAALDASLQQGPDFARFLAALARLGPPLAASHPRAHDDVNELADEVAAP